MSANVFTALGPIGQGMGKIGGASLCGTEYFPVGLTGVELMDWYWMTKQVDAQCAAIATEGATTADFDGGVLSPTTATDRRDLILNGVWLASVPTSASGDATSICDFAVFDPGAAAPNNFALAYDGTLWYPFIQVSGGVTAFDSVLSETSQVLWDSRITTVSSGYSNVGTASILGKSIPLRYNIFQSGGATGTAVFDPPTLTKDSDWPYT